MAIPYPHALWGRLLSLALAVGLSALIFLEPQAIAALDAKPRAMLLTVSLWGIAAGFVHGTGFIPRLAFWRVCFHPATAWLLMTLGSAFLLQIS